jgi:YhcH/YjgK/YiaL family protein
MIVDSIKQLQSYESMVPGMAQIMAFLSGCSDQMEKGRYEIDGDRIYASVIEYDTVAPHEMKFESHREYIDLHVPLSGEECIFWSPVEELSSIVDYNPDNDCEFYRGEYRQLLNATSGLFIFFFPTDGHKVKCHVHGSSHVKKVVIKIKTA